MSRRYAEGTGVSSENSRNEIERTLKRYGADSFMYGTTTAKAVIAFRVHERHIRFSLPFPDPQARQFTHVRRGKYTEELRSDTSRVAVHEQACRQRWRALALSIKAKLEAVEAGITQFEEEFYSHIVLPGGRTIYEETSNNVRVAYESGKMLPLLPHLD